MRRGSKVIRWVLLPALLVAATFLTWWTYRATIALQQLGEGSIIGTTRVLTRQSVAHVDRLIIAADNAVADMVNPDDLDLLATRWGTSGERAPPTARSVMVLDEGLRVLRYYSRASARDAAAYRRLFLDRVLRELHLEDEAPGSHKHLHETFNGTTLLVSYMTREVAGRRHFIVVEADLDYIRDHVLPNLFDDPSVRGNFNVVDDDGRLIYGKRLRGSGGFVVSRNFPTTLYHWRLSVAAQDAPELEAGARRRRLLDFSLVAVSLGILVAGLAFLSYAVRNEQRLNRLKSDFIATVSHELKTPLSLIRMFGEMLLGDRVASSEAKRQQYLEIIVRESERLTALIENVLDFAKLERGKAAYEFSRANLGEVISRGVDLFRYRLERGRPALSLTIAKGVPDTDLDERAIQLLLFNLLDNAIKYAPESEEVRVRVHGNAREVVLEVEDDGPGIDEDDARRIFERFYRGKSARTGGARGSGIGLALVKHIAEAHGGDVAVGRAPGGGARFTVTLAVREAPRTNAAA